MLQNPRNFSVNSVKIYTKDKVVALQGVWSASATVLVETMMRYVTDGERSFHFCDKLAWRYAMAQSRPGTTLWFITKRKRHTSKNSFWEIFAKCAPTPKSTFYVFLTARRHTHIYRIWLQTTKARNSSPKMLPVIVTRFPPRVKELGRLSRVRTEAAIAVVPVKAIWWMHRWGNPKAPPLFIQKDAPFNFWRIFSKRLPKIILAQRPWVECVSPIILWSFEQSDPSYQKTALVTYNCAGVITLVASSFWLKGFVYYQPVSSSSTQGISLACEIRRRFHTWTMPRAAETKRKLNGKGQRKCLKLRSGMTSYSRHSARERFASGRPAVEWKKNKLNCRQTGVLNEYFAKQANKPELLWRSKNRRNNTEVWNWAEALGSEQMSNEKCQRLVFSSFFSCYAVLVYRCT